MRDAEHRLPAGLRNLAAAIAPVIGLPGLDRHVQDWDEVEQLADRHRVTALLSRSSLLAMAPPPVRDRLRTMARYEALRSLERLAFQREAVTALGEAGVAVIVLKGAVLAEEAYGDANAREAIDVDLLVRLSQLEPAFAVLQELEMVPAVFPRWLADDTRSIVRDAARSPLLSEVQLVGRGTMVDLQWRLTANPHLMPTRDHWLSGPERVSVGGVPVPVLPMPERWWYAFAHGGAHHWMRLKWLTDIAAWAVRDPSLVEVDALRHSEQAGLERCVAGGLDLAEELFGPFLSEPARDWVGANTHVRAQTWARTALVSDKPKLLAGWRDPLRYGLATLVLRRGLAYRQEQVRRLLLLAGRSQGKPDPKWSDLLRGVPAWLARRARS